MSKSIKLFIFGLLLGPILAESLGFISVFVSLADNKLGDTLKNVVYQLFPFSSLVFSASLIMAINSGSKLILKIWGYILSLLFVVSSSYGFFESNTTIEILFYNLNYLCKVAGLLTGSIVIYRYVKAIKPEQVTV